jgi:hypothetical protein
VYVLAGVLHILFHFGIHRIAAVRLFTLAAVVVLTCVLVFGESTRASLWSAISPLFTSNVNGLAARYARNGSLAPNIEYILAHPWTPVGVRYSEDLWFVDSGPVEHMLRGSLVLVVAVYFGLFRFLRENLRSLAHCLILLGVYFAFESGFSNLIYLRTLYLTPFIITFLNGVSRDRGSRGLSRERLSFSTQELVAA